MRKLKPLKHNYKKMAEFIFETVQKSCVLGLAKDSKPLNLDRLNEELKQYELSASYNQILKKGKLVQDKKNLLIDWRK